MESAGVKEVRFDASGLPSGIYFYRLTATNQATGQFYSDAKKMMLIK